MTQYATEDGGPAFPQDSDQYGPQGMSLRDWFAGQALAGNIGNPWATDAEALALRFYKIADAMIAARKETK